MRKILLYNSEKSFSKEPKRIWIIQGVMMSIHSTWISKRLEFRVELGLLNQNVCRDGKPEGRKKDHRGSARQDSGEFIGRILWEGFLSMFGLACHWPWGKTEEK